MKTRRSPQSAGQKPRGKAFFTAAQIGDFLQVSKHTARQRARREGWPARKIGNRVEFAPPANLRPADAPLPVPALIFQTDKIRELKRAAAVLGFIEEMQLHPHRGIERALAATALNFSHIFPFTSRALRAWISTVERAGLAGLRENKLGRVGRKAARLHLILK